MNTTGWYSSILAVPLVIVGALAGCDSETGAVVLDLVDTAESDVREPGDTSASADGAASDLISADVPEQDDIDTDGSLTDIGDPNDTRDGGPNGRGADDASEGADDVGGSGLDVGLLDVGPLDVGPLDVGPLDVGPLDVGDLGGDLGADVPGPEVPEGTVAGTPLDGLTIAWSASMDLCSGWTEGAPVVDERLRRVRIHMPPQTRVSLEPKDFALAHYEGLHIERGPFMADRTTIPLTGAATLLSWSIQPAGSGASYVVAELETDLGENYGKLLERWSVGRAPGDTTPVKVNSPELFVNEVTFAWAPPGDVQPALLVPCAPPPSLEPAVSVVVAEDAATKDAAVLLRYWYTSATDAGSHPVWLAGHRLVSREGEWWRIDEAHGYWAHTYSAKHHNFDDETEVDFAGDAGRWHTHFKAPDPALTAISRVTLNGVFGFGTGSMTIERITGSSVTSTTLPVPKPNLGMRVDSLALARTLQPECDGGEALALGGGELLLQLLFCPDGGEKGLVGVVPVVWSPDPTLAAVRYNTSATVTGLNGPDYEVQIGAHRLHLIAQGGGAYLADVMDSIEAQVASAYGVPEPLTVQHPRRDDLTVTNGESGTAAVSFTLDRLWAGFGVGKSQLWAPVAFSLSAGDKAWVVTSWDALDYTNTHHNWNDSLAATADDGTVLTWGVSFVSGVPNEVSATAADGTVLLAPTVLTGQP